MTAAEPQRLRKIDLCRKFGIVKTTLDRYLNLPDAPKPDKAKTYDVIAVTEFIGANSTRAGEKDAIKALRAKKLGLECERIALELNVERGNFVSRSEIVPAIARLWGELHALCRQKFEFELPSRYVGKNAIECAQINIEALEHIDKRFKAGSELKTS